jgi:ABC-2 type transport system ATP-binding protein
MEPAIETAELSRRFGRVEAVKGVTFHVGRGEIFGLLGPNGAGKSTTLKMLANLLEPTGGRATVLGKDSRRLGACERRRIGYVAEDLRLPEVLTATELLAYVRPLYSSWDDAFAARLLKRFAVPRSTPIGALSRGMRMKLALVSSLAFHPELLILDEPFSGLDPLVRDEFLAGLLEIIEQESWSVLISSHDVDEVGRIADTIGILNQGRLELAESVESLLARFRRMEALLLPDAPLSDLPASWIGIERDGDHLRFVETRYDETATRRLVEAAFPGVSNVSAEPLSLRAIFVALARHYRLYAEGEI